MSTLLADLKHPDAAHDDAEDSSENSIEFSGYQPHASADRVIDDVDTFVVQFVICLAVTGFGIAALWGLGAMVKSTWAAALWSAGAAVLVQIGGRALWLWKTLRVSLRDTVSEAEAWRAPQEELERAVKSNNAAHVRRVLEGRSLNINRYYGSYEPTLLHTAVREAMSVAHRTPEDTRAAVDIVKTLIKYGARANTLASRFGYAGDDTALDLVQAAQKKGQCVPDGLMTALREQMEKEDGEDREAEADSYHTDIADKWHPFFVRAASQRDPASWSETLLWSNVDIHSLNTFDDVLQQRDSTDRTVLHWAAWTHNLDLVRWLARKGAPLLPKYVDDVDGEHYGLPFDFAAADPTRLADLEGAYAAGLCDREADALRESLVDEPEAEAVRTRKRL